jgi:hypothetical protein
MPTELVVITVAFALVAFGLLALIAKVLFFGGFALPKLVWPSAAAPQGDRTILSPAGAEAEVSGPRTRAFVISANSTAEAVAEPLGRSFRVSEARGYRRSSAAADQRDRKA